MISEKINVQEKRIQAQHASAATAEKNPGGTGSAAGRRIRQGLRLAADALLDCIYPDNLYCISCGDTIESATRVHGLCDSCIRAIHWYGQEESPEDSSLTETDADPAETEKNSKETERKPAAAVHDPAQADAFAFDRFWYCCIYGYHARNIMNGLKLRGRSYYAKNLGLLMAERVLRGCEEEGLDPEEFDLILAVPSTAAKKEQRGYNQAELLARRTAEELGMKNRFLSGGLVKVKETPSLRFSDGRTRRSALADVFAVEHPSVFREKRILLIDDVSTTGSTGDACARVLKDAGAAEVSFLCFASAHGENEN